MDEIYNKLDEFCIETDPLFAQIKAVCDITCNAMLDCNIGKVDAVLALRTLLEHYEAEHRRLLMEVFKAIRTNGGNSDE